MGIAADLLPHVFDLSFGKRSLDRSRGTRIGLRLGAVGECTVARLRLEATVGIRSEFEVFCPSISRPVPRQ
jgi:hypothetical protein